MFDSLHVGCLQMPLITVTVVSVLFTRQIYRFDQVKLTTDVRFHSFWTLSLKDSDQVWSL